MSALRGALLAVLSTSVPALADADDGGWVAVIEGPPITISTRVVEGQAVKELRAEGDFAAPVQDVQATLTASETFWRFMPYVRESRVLDLPPEADGARLTYALVDTPMVGRRDYVLAAKVEETVRPDGSGSFRSSFVARPDTLPERNKIIRIRLDQGSWVVTPLGDGSTCHAVYQLLVDPGGWIPAFAANAGTKKGLPDTFRAVEKEAQRRRDERLAEAKKAAPPIVLVPAREAAPAVPSVAP